MSEEYRNGVNAAAHLLRRAAEDFEQMAAQQRATRDAMGPGSYALRSKEVQMLLRNGRAYDDKARLLRGLADRIQAELTP